MPQSDDAPARLRETLAHHPVARALIDGALAEDADPSDPATLAGIAAQLPHNPEDPDTRLMMVLSLILEQFVNHQEQVEEELIHPDTNDRLQE